MATLPHSLFTTTALPERERFAAWREDMSVIFDVDEVPGSSEARNAFHATFELYLFGRSVLGGLSSSTGRYIRSRSKAKRDGLDAILIQLFLEGGVQFGVDQRTTYAEAGDIVVFDLAQPVDNVNRKFRHITSMWPRAEIEVVVPNIAQWHGRALPRSSPTVRLLREHMVSGFDLANQLSITEGRRVEDATLSLVQAALGDDSLPPEALEAPSMSEMLAYQIKRYVREHLALSDLSPELIARHFGISRRQLYYLMEPVGGISRYQLHLRLKRCLHDIQNPEQAHRTLSEIAYQWGFKNPATFSRNFRKAFGITPGEARDQIRSQATHPTALGIPAPAKSNQRLAHEHHQWFHSIGI